jgi:hypothetical protein
LFGMPKPTSMKLFSTIHNRPRGHGTGSACPRQSFHSTLQRTAKENRSLISEG